MALRTTVYLGNVSNLSDARYGAGMGVAYLGFPMDGKNAISPETYTEIVSWVSGPASVMEFTSSSADQIRKIAGECEADLVCVNDPVLARELLGSEFGIIYDNTKNTKAPDIALEAIISHELVTSDDFAHTYPVFLAKDITVENLDNYLGHPNIGGITLYGSNEIRPGYKDYDEIADILEYLEVD